MRIKGQKMDQIVTDHSPEHLEQLFNAIFIKSTDTYSLIAQKTTIPWLQFIPKIEMNEAQAIGALYGEIHAIAFDLQKREGFGHFNVAKIGNKHPAYHIHLVFREETDEAWPDAIWGRELTPSITQANALKEHINAN